MKKILTSVLAAAMMLLGTQAFAQIAVGTGYKMLTNKTEKTSSSIHGAYLGVDYTLPIAGGFAVTPGVNFTYATGSSDKSFLGGLVSGKSTLDEMYISVPVRVSYNLDLSNDIKAFVFAGPSLDYGLSSKTKLNGNVAGVSADKSINNYDGDYYKPLDVKLGGGAGIDLLGVTRVVLGYDMGMLNRGTENATIKTNLLYVGVSLLF